LRPETVRQILCLGHAEFRDIMIRTAKRLGSKRDGVGGKKFGVMTGY
jgi:hypothetical protein